MGTVLATVAPIGHMALFAYSEPEKMATVVPCLLVASGIHLCMVMGLVTINRQYQQVHVT